MLRRVVLTLLLVSLVGCMEHEKKDPDTKADARLKRVAPLYERLGREAGITKVVDDFVTAVVANPDIRDDHKKHFKAADIGVLKRKLIDQIGEATGGPQKYKGRNMKDAHQGLGITDSDFNALVASLKTALVKNNVGDAEQKELFALLGPMRNDVVEKK